jgi:HPt (histidine-containing phosphotransfer) domain-containing protein
VTQPVLAREIFDRLRQAAANNPEMLIELCRDYVAEARTAVAEIRVALDASDAARLRDRAHYLKGSSMMMGARELSQRCSSLEQMGRDSDLTGAELEYAGALSALKEVEAELQRELGPAVLPPA